jgi:hypothetical protein
MEAVPSEPECRCSLDAPVGLGCRWRRRRDGGGTKSAFTVIKFRSVVVVATAAKSYDKKRKITHSGYEWRRGDERWSGIQFFCQWVRVCSFVHRSLSSHSSLPCLSFPHFSFFRFFFLLTFFLTLIFFSSLNVSSFSCLYRNMVHLLKLPLSSPLEEEQYTTPLSPMPVLLNSTMFSSSLTDPSRTT